MKTKKVLMISLLGAALVATSACTLFGGTKKSGKKKKSSSTTITSVEPGPGQRTVARIKITQLASAVTGDEINLDDYIDIVYDDDSTDKNFEVEVPEGFRANHDSRSQRDQMNSRETQNDDLTI